MSPKLSDCSFKKKNTNNNNRVRQRCFKQTARFSQNSPATKKFNHSREIHYFLFSLSGTPPPPDHHHHHHFTNTFISVTVTSSAKLKKHMHLQHFIQEYDTK
ncbi:hypothetical protein E3U43_014972 [Larimichthys crocea]|uniref:Uncharacterized protein n=1 Tax=Larimichthys crocea TaxID=215358 RepID=A0ACD3RNG4_LARCR|nr:hypothetical protein E3U43_014972 [Larimichthys crocea]